MRTYGCVIPKEKRKVTGDPLKLEKLILKSVDLRQIYSMPTIIDQGNLGSCTGCAFSYLYNFNEIKQRNLLLVKPSVLYIYYNERLLRGTVKYDSGAEIYDGIVAISKYGICDNIRWPYLINKFTTRPSTQSYNQGKLFKSISSSGVNQDLSSIKTLLSNNIIFVFGFYVYESFESVNVEKTGMVPIPNTNTEALLGGHAGVCIGYNDNKITLEGKKGMFICANSWGINWGDKGYYYMPYDYLTNPDLAGDFWTITKVTNPKTLQMSIPKNILGYTSLGR